MVKSHSSNSMPSIGDFEAGIDDGAMFGSALVEDRIGVVDVNQDAAALRIAREEFEQAVFAGEREMAHVARFLFAAAGLDEFVVAPEGAVEESDAAGGGGFGPVLIAAGDRWRDEDAFSFAFENEADVGFVGRQGAADFFADVIGIRAAERNRRDDERRLVAGIFGEMDAEAAFALEEAPLNRGIGAIEHVEDFVFFFQDALERSGAEDEERLKLAQVQQAHHFVDVGGGQEHAADRGVGRAFVRAG